MRIRLTESQLHRVIKESVKSILSEITNGIHNDGQIDLFANQRDVNKIDRSNYESEKPTDKQIIDAVDDIMGPYGSFSIYRNLGVYNERQDNEKYWWMVSGDKLSVDDYFSKLKDVFPYPNLLSLGNANYKFKFRKFNLQVLICKFHRDGSCLQTCL
jgi:hypothetical protein